MSVMTNDTINALLADEARRRPGAEVLEAGCGRWKHFDYPDDMLISGLDISKDQLALNEYAHRTYLGDVQTFVMDRQFDVVVSVFVLEHVDAPEAALRNMLQWTRPGGLLVVAVPNALSLKGLVTKFTPFWFHHAFYRYVYRRPYAIFPTTMKFCIAPRALRRFFAGHEVVLEEYFTERLSQPFHAVYTLLLGILRLLTLFRWQPGRSNYRLVVRKVTDDSALTQEPEPSGRA